ncbi:hypothetical protein ColKHC_12937 [Colletotrichum higginsianum]|nr:hypothetical protein ColKHC_12937 [Colletotrichum higginsianum]
MEGGRRQCKTREDRDPQFSPKIDPDHSVGWASLPALHWAHSHIQKRGRGRDAMRCGANDDGCRRKSDKSSMVG